MEFSDGNVNLKTLNICETGQINKVEAINVTQIKNSLLDHFQTLLVEKAGSFVNVNIEDFSTAVSLKNGQSIKIAEGLPIPIFAYGEGMNNVGFLGISKESGVSADVAFTVNSKGELIIIALGDDIKLKSCFCTFTYIVKA